MNSLSRLTAFVALAVCFFGTTSKALGQRTPEFVSKVVEMDLRILFSRDFQSRFLSGVDR